MLVVAISLFVCLIWGVTANPGVEFYKPILGELKLGEHPLMVPWEKGAIQLNVVVQEGILIAPFLVTVQEDLIGLRREGDREFQVHDNVRPVGSPEQRGQTELFEGPVRGVALHGSAALAGTWRAETRGSRIVNISGFDTFLSLIFLGVYKQQNPNMSIADITRFFDEYPDL